RRSRRRSRTSGPGTPRSAAISRRRSRRATAACTIPARRLPSSGGSSIRDSCRPAARRPVVLHASGAERSTSAGSGFRAGRNAQEEIMRHRTTPLILLAGAVICAGATRAAADGDRPRHAQIVALDECDPVTFNPAVGPDGTGFCHNVTLYGLGLHYETPLGTLIGEANAGTPDPGWDFEPDEMTVDRGTTLSVVDQGGEPHTFTEVAHFGGGFVEPLNAGQPTVPECA